MNTHKLAKAFELWASSYWAQGLDTEYMIAYGAYVDEQVEMAWQAFQAARRLAATSVESALTVAVLERKGCVTEWWDNLVKNLRD